MFKIELTIPTNKVKKNSFQHRGLLLAIFSSSDYVLQPVGT